MSGWIGIRGIFQNDCECDKMTKTGIETILNKIIESTTSSMKYEESRKTKTSNYNVLLNRLIEAEDLKSELYKYDYSPEFFSTYFEVRLRDFESPIL